MDLRSLLLCLLMLLAGKSFGCFILYLSDGTNVLVGNHEDWTARDAGVRIFTPAADRFGSVTFTFLSEGWAQGGMNDHGLFFDAARTPYQEEVDEGKPAFPGYIWQGMLDHCRNVEEALAFLGHYELPELSETTFLLADSSGHAVLLGLRYGKFVTRSVTRGSLMQTNFNSWQPELSDEPSFSRYETATRHLEADPEVSEQNVLSILEQTHQDSLTVYSNIYDLKNLTVTTYYERHFNRAVALRLPDIFKYGDCIWSLDSLENGQEAWGHCLTVTKNMVELRGKVIDRETHAPIAYANIGLFDKNIGTLSDPDGSFVLEIPQTMATLPVAFSCIGYDHRIYRMEPGRDTQQLTIALAPNSTVLNPVTIADKRESHKVTRLGWMGGKDGVLPLDTVQGGGAVALLVHAPTSPCRIEQLQVRLMYNSKDTLKLRLHFYALDSLRQQPGRELLTKEIMLTETKRFGWLRYDLTDDHIIIDQKNFFVGFEWIDDRQTRKQMVAGLRDWERWKKRQYEQGNQKVQQIFSDNDGKLETGYKYYGNMMDWPGFKSLPPFTGLMVQTGKNEETQALKTFERKTSFGPWSELGSTLNCVITVIY